MRKQDIPVLLLCMTAGWCIVGCQEDDQGPYVDQPPVIMNFSVDTDTIGLGLVVNFQMTALDDVGLDSAVLNYGDDTRFLINLSGRKRLSAASARNYDSVGVFNANLIVYDTQNQSVSQSLSITVHN